MGECPPGPRDLSLFRFQRNYTRNPLGSLHTLANTFGDVASFRLGNQTYVLLNHPDHVKHVLIAEPEHFGKARVMERAQGFLGEGLLSSEGEVHLRQRRTSLPAFRRDRLSDYGDVMIEYGLRYRARWTNGTLIDVASEMLHLTLAVLGKTIFGTDVEPEADDITRALAVTADFYFTRRPARALWLDAIFPSRVQHVTSALGRLHDTIDRMIHEHRRDPVSRSDWLSIIIRGRSTDSQTKGWEHVHLRDETMTMLLAGHVTVANALTWTWYLLSQNPEVEVAFHQELHMVLDGKAPTVAHVRQLRYTEMIFAEALRLYPPVWALERRAYRACRFDGYTVPEDAIVILCAYLMQRDARFFHEPERFHPGRWEPDLKAMSSTYVYFPFGAGPRQCLGEQFGWLEGILLLASLGQQWQLRLMPGHPVTPYPQAILRPARGMPMMLEQRSPLAA